MGNERLRKQMVIFAMVFVAVSIVVIYMKDWENKKHGTTDMFGTPSNDWRREYYENGKVKSEGAMKEGYLKEGEWIYYREDGSIMLREKYKGGVLVEVTEDGKIRE